MTQKTTTKFGIYGGQFVPESLIPTIEEFAIGAPGAGNGNSVVRGFEA